MLSDDAGATIVKNRPYNPEINRRSLGNWHFCGKTEATDQQVGLASALDQTSDRFQPAAIDLAFVEAPTTHS